jgi:hypothetical protein
MLYETARKRQRSWGVGWRRKGGSGWKEGYLGRGIINWFRAARYENSGLFIGAWPWWVAKLAVFLPVLNFGIGYTRDIKEGDGTPEVAVSFLTLSDASRTGLPEEFQFFATSVMVVYIFLLTAVGAVALSPDWFYPISRRDRARIAFFTYLIQTVLNAAIIGLGLTVAVVGVGAVSGAAVLRGVGFYWSILLWCVVLAPFLQWGRLAYRSWSGWVACYAVAVVVGSSFIGLYHLFLLDQVGNSLYLPLACVAVLAHGGFYLKLERYYTRADLA